jgi:hypothetical protein
MNLFIDELIDQSRDQADREGCNVTVEQVEKILPRLMMNF